MRETLLDILHFTAVFLTVWVAVVVGIAVILSMAVGLIHLYHWLEMGLGGIL